MMCNPLYSGLCLANGSVIETDVKWYGWSSNGLCFGEVMVDLHLCLQTLMLTKSPILSLGDFLGSLNMSM